ncbi:Acetyltransferase YpeA [Caloramator mitchellensis]|uniref:Acetyltransferase YpeA n=1 Tax=Caloramator mitchellensis TaxID=908809 RepID=A0A0R3K201_CALMK|nr:GNAT family N-acetyltransferase [Caloramator mitchellensis]KRQ86914.1 Acetyltransferase YpeA [Caloramator mitchellensis]
MEYVNGLDADLDDTFKAFCAGFSDYIIKFSISKEDFISRFFGPEGNSLELTYVALDDKKPVGVILGGIKEFDGIKTLRCGALAVHPEYRGKGISQKLFNLHKEQGLLNGCKQLFLEVIVGNDRAINFYKKHGYEKIYDISYFKLEDITKIKDYNNTYESLVKRISFDEFEVFYRQIKGVHVNWQNDIDYIKKSSNNMFYGTYFGKENKLIGVLCINNYGKVSYIWVEKENRNNGIASSMLKAAVNELNLSKIFFSFPNNCLLENFVKKKGFTRDKISQYEMYLIV